MSKNVVRSSTLQVSFEIVIRNFWEILSTIYYRYLPEKIRNMVSQKGETIYSRITRTLFLISQLWLDFYLIEGIAKGGESNLISLYIGEEETLPFFYSTAYKETPKINKIGRIFFWNIFRKIKQNSPSVDLALVLTNKFFIRFLVNHGYFIIPKWVTQKLDISKPLEEVWSNLSKNEKESLRKTKARIRKYGYSYEVSHNMETLEYFYHKIYMPFTLERHGELSELASLSYMRRAFRRGGLLMVKEGDEYVAGLLFIIARGETFHVFRWGVASGEEYLKRGVGGFLYYFSIMWAKQQGYKEVDFGGSRAFMDDGVFRYKKKWGATVSENNWLPSTFGLKLFKFNDGVRDFLSCNPFIFVNGGDLRGLVLVSQKDPLTQEQLERLFQIYYVPSLKDLTVISAAGFAEDAQNQVTERPEEKVRLVHWEADSSMANCLNQMMSKG